VRLRSDIWVAALIRRAQHEGAYAALRRRGAEQAGAIFIIVNDLEGRFLLYAPAPQMAFDETAPPDRLFALVLEDCESDELEDRLDQEISFDSDCWIVEIEDRQRRPFVEIMEE
jgi:hypothetical protein